MKIGQCRHKIRLFCKCKGYFKVIKVKHVPGKPNWEGEFEEAQNGDKEIFDAVKGNAG